MVPQGGQTWKVVVLHPGDDVAVALEELKAGTVLKVAGRTVKVVNDIPAGHKVALGAVRRGRPVFKYGERIGVARADIAAGQHVHSHNMELELTAHEYNPGAEVEEVEYRTEEEVPAFMGYLRPDGSVGTRNYVLVISTVNCSASAARAVAGHFTPELLEKYPNVDGVVAITHKSGCAMQLGGEDYEQLQRTLAGFARNPNVAGSVIVGLGCEVNQAADLIANTGLAEENTPHGGPPRKVVIQEHGGFEAAVNAGIEAVQELLTRAAAARRTMQPVSKLVVGLECGGSDANSGIAGNPVVGAATDELVRCGGTAVFGETPEIYGAEHLLIRRARIEEVAARIAQHVQWWERYTRLFGAEIDNNPTPGNKAGGLTTIYEKSLGAIAKAGTTPLNAVYNYGERITEKGLVFMDTPGFDSVSITGFIAGGANLVIFTTGRGSVYGSVPAPTIKVATNSRLYRAMSDDMDIDAGPVLGGTPVADIGGELFDLVVAVASGKRTASERTGIGQEEFSPWTIGPVL